MAEAHEYTALREQLAAIEHERWGHWQRYMHSVGTRNMDGSLTIPAGFVAGWERQIATPYADLSDREKASDLEQVDRYWPLLLAEVRRLRAVLVALTDDDYLAWGASIHEEFWQCHWCHAHGSDITDEPREADHDPACLWARARHMVREGGHDGEVSAHQAALRPRGPAAGLGRSRG